MYAGEVHIDQTKLQDLLEVAEYLKIKGLAGKSTSSSESQGKMPTLTPNPPVVKPPSTEKPKVPSADKTKVAAAEKTKVPSAEKTGKTPALTNKNVPVASKTPEKKSESLKPVQNLPPSILEPLCDPLSLLEPQFYEDGETETPRTPSVDKAPKKTPVKKVKKRRHSEQEWTPPPVLLRKGTKSRPNVKVPKHYHDNYESLQIKHTRDDSNSQDSIIKIKSEPFDADEVDMEEFCRRDPDAFAKVANENLNILDTLKLKQTKKPPRKKDDEEVEKEGGEGEVGNESINGEKDAKLKALVPKIKIVDIKKYGKDFDAATAKITVLDPSQIISKMGMTGGVEITPVQGDENGD